VIYELTVKPVCKTGKIRKDGSASIGIQYCFTSKKRALLDSGLAILNEIQKNTTLTKAFFNEPNVAYAK